MNVIRSLVALLFLAGAVFGQDTYSIRLARPVKAGDRFKVAARAAVISKTVREVEKVPEENDEVNLACKVSGELTVVAVTSKGMASELVLKLEEAQTFDGGEESEIFSSGDVISVKKGTDENVVTVNGEEADEEQSELIDVLMSVAGDDEATDDEAFGTDKKVKVGDEWTAHRDVLAHEMVRQDIRGLKPTDLTAYAKLLGTMTINGEPALKVSCSMSFSSPKVRMRKLGEGLKADMVSADVHSELDLPVNLESTATHARATTKFNVVAKGTIQDDEGRPVPVQITTDRRTAIDASETPIR
jgi:hypothetical protein